MDNHSESANIPTDFVLTEPTLQAWDSGQTVIELQELLCAHGFNLRVDGDFGSITEEAVAAYQRQQGLRVDGVVGSKTWTALKTTVQPGTRILKQGYTGADVRYLQGLLQILGYNVPHDGQFGASTQQAVIAFQQKHKLKPDGLVNFTTWTVLQGNPPLPTPPKQTRWTFNWGKWW
jgi:peptidoglycan hydrolase-like protein with peptidoglycan-binding domain